MRGRSTPVRAVDHAWLRMERPTNLMVISGFFAFDEPLDADRVRTVLRDRLVRVARFAERLETRGLTRTSHWVPVDEVDLRRHVDEVHLAPADDAAFHALVDRLVATPLAKDRPLWHATIVQRPGDGSTVVFRVHHAVGDGMALLAVLLSVCDSDPDGPPPSAPTGARPRGRVGRAVTRVGHVARTGVDLVRHPLRVPELVGQGAAMGRALARIVLLSPDPPNPLRGDLGKSKRAAWTEPIPIDEVKRVARREDATINDVLVSHLSGALGRYFAARGHPPDVAGVRAMVPVNIRPVEAEPHLGNRFGLVLPDLPVGIEDHTARVRETKRQMDTIKRTPEALVSYGILQTIGATTNTFQQLVVSFFGTKTSAVLTNVIGPRTPVWLAGHRIRRMMFWVPQSADLAIGMSIFSYDGAVGIGIICDAGLVPDPQTIVNHIHEIHAETLETAGGGRPRCTATTRRGRRCRNGAGEGVAVCHVHR